jgi:hypothetical protein
MRRAPLEDPIMDGFGNIPHSLNHQPEEPWLSVREAIWCLPNDFVTGHAKVETSAGD